jgi:hypothetical protein
VLGTVVELMLGWADKYAFKSTKGNPYMGVPQVSCTEVKNKPKQINAENLQTRELS